MIFVSKRRPRPQVPIVALIDILAILLIFFIVTTTFKKDEQTAQAESREALLSIVLPKAGALQVRTDPAERLTLALTREGDIFLEEAKVDLQELIPILQGLKLERPETKLELRVDGRVRLELLIAVWDALAKAGIQIKDVPSRLLWSPEPGTPAEDEPSPDQ